MGGAAPVALKNPSEVGGGRIPFNRDIERCPEGVHRRVCALPDLRFALFVQISLTGVEPVQPPLEPGLMFGFIHKLNFNPAILLV